MLFICAIRWNALTQRAETLLEKPAFRNLVSQRRLIPADGFYEWRREGNRKVPVWIHLKNNRQIGTVKEIRLRPPTPIYSAQ